MSKVVVPSFAVARKAPRSEGSTKQVQKALNEEMEKQFTAPRHPSRKGKGTWNVATACGQKALFEWARREGIAIHVTRACVLCYEKGSELPDGH